MIVKIEAADDVKAFEKQLFAEEFSFHPDDYCNENISLKENRPCCSTQEADLGNNLMDRRFEVCKIGRIDIHHTMLEVSLIETGMSKFIPLPSQPSPENN